MPECPTPGTGRFQRTKDKGRDNEGFPDFSPNLNLNPSLNLSFGLDLNLNFNLGLNLFSS
jgi:hypothetical protein